MRRLAFLLLVSALFSLSVAPAHCQSPSAPTHLVIEFSDIVSPVMHQVEAQIGGGSGVFRATLEMPDVRCAFFRIRRLTGDAPDQLKVLSQSVRLAEGPVFPFDEAILDYTNASLRDLPRFLSYREGSYLIGKVVVGFKDDTDEEEVITMFEAGAVPFKSNFPHTFAVWCIVTSGDPGGYIMQLEQSDIVMWAEQKGDVSYYYPTPPRLLVKFNARASMEAARELISGLRGLEWDEVSVAPKWGVITVQPGKEYAWILALEADPRVEYAHPDWNGILF